MGLEIMNEENIGLELAKEAIKEIGKDVYADGGKQIVQPTGDLLGLIPRAIKAALFPLEKWILQREYNVAEIKQLLELKLQDTDPKLIESPEPHIAVPAMQYISYCMDNEELREMYANLLANSMNKVVKNGVHPGFVEIIKQLSPDEAKILRYMNSHQIVPTVTLRYVYEEGGGVDIIKNFSNVGDNIGCENPKDSAKYFDNLVRLGLITDLKGMSSLTDKTIYEPLKHHSRMTPYASKVQAKARGFNDFKFEESYVEISEYGKSFCSICLNTHEIINLEYKEG